MHEPPACYNQRDEFSLYEQHLSDLKLFSSNVTFIKPDQMFHIFVA